MYTYFSLRRGRVLFQTELDTTLVADIRYALNTGLVLGNEWFREEVEQLTGRRHHNLKQGPKPKTTAN